MKSESFHVIMINYIDTKVEGTSISTAEVDQPSRHRHHWVELAVEWLGDTFDWSVG